jgi:hypothetical protein
MTEPRWRVRNQAARAHNKALKIARGQCRDCGLEVTERNYVAFDWDHIDPTTKVDMVSNMRIIDAITAETEKCVLLCRNCHAIKTWIENAWKHRDTHPLYRQEQTDGGIQRPGIPEDS